MGKNKLKKFRDMEALDCVLQYPFSVLNSLPGGFPLKGRWGEDFFHNSNPIVLELGCGKGEYTVGLAQIDPSKNYIGIDIKGARMWSGAKKVAEKGLKNAAFLRTSIELLPQFFAPGEVSEIWITFPDPQMQKVRKRLTGTRFVEMYRSFMAPDGVIRLKTDSPFLFTYTSEMLKASAVAPVDVTADVYASPLAERPELQIRTHYEQQWLDRGLSIKYIAFRTADARNLVEPCVDIPFDTYRSYSRGQVQCPELADPFPTFFDEGENS